MTLSPVLLSTIELALNRWLRLDPESLQAIDRVAGSVICLHVTGLEIRLYYLPEPEHITVMGSYEGEVDATIHASAANLIKMSLSDDAASQFLETDSRIEGNIGLATAFTDILKNVQIDWEELLSKVVGDIVAHGAGDAARQTSGWIRESSQAMQLNVAEYLSEEIRLVVTEAELGHYLEQVDELRHAADRLQARVKRLQQHLDSKTGS